MISNKFDNKSLDLTSIIILTRNKLDYTQGCIESIRKYTEPETYEIIVVDNCSSDGTQEWLKDQTDVRTIFNGYNAGFPKGCNQGIEIAQGNSILLLNNDVLVTPNWLNILLNGLYGSEKTGAVGPVTNQASYYQAIPTTYNSITEMYNFSNMYNRPDSRKWEKRIKLVGFCMLIKREVIDKVGLLDERFTPGNYEDDDFSYRILKEGYELKLCKDVFIHHYGSVSFRENNKEYAELLQTNEVKFIEKWGFNTSYSSFIRNEIIEMIDHQEEAELNVLEVGCACGGTLLGIKNRFTNAQLFGLELNPNSAAIASTFANVRAADVEKDLDYPLDYFDYIILPDVLEHLNDPWFVVGNLKKYLKEDGKILASIPNVMHYTVMRDVLKGSWTYTEAGLLDKTHLRFFTLFEIDKMFKEAGYHSLQFGSNVLPMSEEDIKFIDMLANVGHENLVDQYKSYQYLVKAYKNEMSNIAALIQKLEFIEEQTLTLSKIVELMKNESISIQDVIEQVKVSHISDKQNAYNILAVEFYKQELYEQIIPVLHESLVLDSKHRDTLYNLGYLLYKAGDCERAKHYLDKIEVSDNELEELRQLINL